MNKRGLQSTGLCVGLKEIHLHKQQRPPVRTTNSKKSLLKTGIVRLKNKVKLIKISEFFKR